MSDLIELERLIKADSAERGQAVSKLGYFCAPFRPVRGPLANKVIKVYRGLRNVAELERLAQCHSDYVAALELTGVDLPATEFHLLDIDGTTVPVIVQEALPSDSMMRPQIIAAELEQAVEMMEAAGQVIATFWNNADKVEGRVGFHPSIRNFAYLDGKALFFDTFPPLIHYSRDEMGKMLLTYSDKRLMRWVGPFIQGRVTGIQDEWYSAPETLVGLVGSACRLRPDDSVRFLEWGQDFARRAMPRWAEEAIPEMKAPPKLPAYWTGFRKVLGLQGEPNV
ncbi:MAG TPA: hypothetical protein DHC76_04280 [Rhodobacteraceae bacterium]|jgi:hypothetical protein|uniref:DUF6206 family protein n=1 Tax=Planktotalea sp. TaxID=2029877 RepID=UPI000183A397|nr:conserved hypothetical protein [Rhodobacteraceae bacterium HTCC2083]HCW83215.1 hypothetical protein [Paracoccaceae bacterium]